MITLGVDLGGTNLRAALVGDDGSMLAANRVRLQSSAPEAVLAAIVELVENTAGAAGLPSDAIAALCVAVAGQIHLPTGVVALGPNLGWKNVPFGTMLSEAFPFPVRIENDLSAAAWGEMKAGAGQGSDHLALLAVGSGVGAGLIERGRLVDGEGGLAGEIGHTKVVRDGEPCGCGELGCLEAYTGGHRMTSRASRFWAEAGIEKPQGLDPSKITMRTVHEAFEGGDAVAVRVLEEAGAHLGLAAANLVSLLNPSHLILAGGVLLGVPYLVERIKEAVFSQTSAPARAQVAVEIAALGDDAGVIGAGYLARDFARRP